MIRHASLALLITASLQVQNAPAPAAIVNKLDTPQARVYVATLQPRTPSRSPNGHSTTVATVNAAPETVARNRP